MNKQDKVERALNSSSGRKWVFATAALVLTQGEAKMQGFGLSMPMSRIVLKVFSALGLGRTAGVATNLADEGIPCNMVVTYYHDNVFVPESMAAKAVKIISEVQRRATSSERQSASPPVPYRRGWAIAVAFSVLLVCPCVGY